MTKPALREATDADIEALIALKDAATVAGGAVL